MRRKILKNKSIIISLVIVATFTFLSFFFDQLVVQQENNIRKKNTEISNKKIELSQNLFLLNSIFNISKDLSYSTRLRKTTLDDAYSRRSLFSNPEDYGNSKDEILLSGVAGFQKHLEYHDEIYLTVLNNHNKKTDTVKFYLDNFKKNKVYLKAIEMSEWNLNYLLEDLDKYYITEDEFEKFRQLRKTKIDWDLFVTNNDPHYNFYSKIRDKLHDLGYLADTLYAASEDVIILHINGIKDYENSLINFSKVKNKKNFYILLSILFQILALTSLMFLFKIIINQDKK